MKPEETIDFNVKGLWHAIARMYNEEASKYGSTLATAHILLNIDQENGTPSTSLGPKMGMETTSLSRTLKSMEERGLIYRERNPEDGRGVLIKLTPEGVKMRNVSRSAVISFNEQVASHFTPAKLHAFFEVARTINHLIQNKSIQINTTNQTEKLK